jgi:hypothetical protein
LVPKSEKLEKYNERKFLFAEHSTVRMGRRERLVNHPAGLENGLQVVRALPL